MSRFVYRMILRLTAPEEFAIAATPAAAIEEEA